jgi:hypothetical protein
VEQLRERELLELQRIASLTMEEARAEVLRRAEESARIEAIRLAKKIEDEAREMAELRGKKDNNHRNPKARPRNRHKLHHHYGGASLQRV